jgi:UDP-N-acetylmuramoyl-L-alanyl-D-glutamate--2,6-diaminopimelate ligase
LDDIVAETQRGGALRASKSFSESGSDSNDAYDPDFDGQSPILASSSYPPLPQRKRFLPDLFKSIGYFDAAESAPALEITNIITCNSENSSEGSLYVCVPCEEDPEDEELDGHNWADEAAELGAVAVVASQPLPGCLLPVIQVPDTLAALAAIAEEFYDHPAQRIQTIAFIGSYGKTTSSWLARGIFDEAEKDIGIIGDSEYAINTDRLTPEGDIWVPAEDDPTEKLERSSPFRIVERAGKYELPPTTPDALHLQKVLAGIADRGGTIATVEICPEMMMDGRVDCLHPAVLVFTNIDPVLARDCPGGEDEYIERIEAIFASLNENQTAIVNLDDPNGARIARLVEDTDAQLLTYGATTKEADVCAEKTKFSNWETEILVKTPVGRLEIIIPLPGSYNVSNALAAVAVGLASGVKLVSIVAGIEAVEYVPGRTEVIDEGQPFPVIIDSAKTPEQVGRLIDEVKEAGARRTILVIGCPGGTSPEYRMAIGSEAHFKADIVFFTNDSPGLDAPSEIIQDIVNGLPEEVLARHAGSYFPWLQDVHRTPQWFESWLLRYQSEVGRYVIEDRFSAIRVAIGMAKPRDVVLVVGRGQDDRMEYWDGAPIPRTDAERAVGQATKSMADRESPEYKEEERWEAVDAYYAFRAEEGLSVERETITGWFDDSIESRNAIMRVAKNLNKLKDLDRTTLPWTRYPEEREQSGLSGSMGMGEATGAGGLDQYLREMAEEQDKKRREEAGEVGAYDEDEDEDDEDYDEEEEEEEEEGATAY